MTNKAEDTTGTGLQSEREGELGQKAPGPSDESLQWEALVALLSNLERQVNAAEPDQNVDQLLEMRDRVLLLQEHTSELRARIDQVFIAAIELSGPIQIGNARFSVATSRKMVCKDKSQTFERLLEATHGDLGRACDQLVAQPFKTANVRSLLDDVSFSKCFEITLDSAIKESPKRLVKLPYDF